MHKRGFSSLIIVLIIGFVLVSGSLVFLYIKDDNSSTLPVATTENKIEGAVFNKMRSLGLGSGFDSVNNFRLTNIKGNHARGEVVIDGVTKNVHLITINGEDWVVVEISEDPISCEKAERMGYPSSMVSDCLYEYPAAEEVAVILAWTKDELISAGEIEIIGKIELGDDPSVDTFKIVSDDGEFIIITYDPDDENLNNLIDGDYVVINVTPSEDGNGEIILDLNSVEEVQTVEDVIEGEENNSIIDLEPNTNTDTNTDINTDSNTNTDTDSNNDLPSDVIEDTNNTQTDTFVPNEVPTTSVDISNNEPITEEYDITNLTSDTEISEEYYYSLIDRDNSGGVQIISDF